MGRAAVVKAGRAEQREGLLGDRPGVPPTRWAADDDRCHGRVDEECPAKREKDAEKLAARVGVASLLTGGWVPLPTMRSARALTSSSLLRKCR